MQRYLIPLIAAALSGLATWVLLSKSSRRLALVVTLVTAATVWVALFIWQSGRPHVKPPPERRPAAPSTNDTQTTRPEIGMPQLDTMRPVQATADGYVASQVCRECHAENHASWSASYHRTMTQVASVETALGNFDNVQVAAEGRTYRLWHRDNVCWAEMENPDAPPGQSPRVDVPIVMSTGSHHMQVYWYATGHGRLMGQLPLVFLKEANRWIPRDAAFLVPPAVTFSSETGRWNETCIGCHTTHGRPRPDGKGGWDSQVADFGISCEACHGPGQRHVEARRGVPTFGPALPLPPDEAMVNPARLSHRRGAQICGQCHSVSTALHPADFRNVLSTGYRFRPGDDLSQSRVIVRDNPAGRQHLTKYLGAGVEAYLRDRFWADGMIRIAGREYNGLIESACFQQGDLSCLTCHVMHKSADDSRDLRPWANDQLRPGADSNQTCLACHAADQFGTGHTHHAADSVGSRCDNCHMPHTTYGLLKAIRSHQISRPNVRADAQAGRPNACNLCHLDQTLAWSAEHLHDWYGAPQLELDHDQQTIAASLLWLLRGDAGERALTAWSMGWQPAQAASGQDWLAPFLATLLEDPYDAVRFIAARSLRTLPGFETLDYDFIGSVADRGAAREGVWQIWQQRPSERTEEQLLLDDQGALRRDDIGRLLQQRNDREVNLVE